MRPTDIVSVFAPRFLSTGIEWMITGGLASIVYGVPRLTQDLDVVAALEPHEAARLAAQFPEGTYYCPPPVVIAEKAGRDRFGHFNVLHLESDARADVYLAGQDALARRGLDNRRTVRLAALAVPLAPPEYVILQKLRYRQQGATDRHLRDVRAMLRVLGPGIDVERLEVDVNAEGLVVQWREMEALGE